MSTNNITEHDAEHGTEKDVTHENVPMAHDATYKKFFTEPRMVRSLVQDFVSSSLGLRFDFDSLQRMPADFVSDKFTMRHGDMVWRIKLTGTHEGDVSHDLWCYLYVLLEFQSTVDKWMALRINAYSTLLLQELAQAKQLETDDFLPPVLPLVLYTGSGRWTAKLSVTELIMPGLGDLQKYQPQQTYFLLDGSQSLQNPDSEGLASLFVRLEKTSDIVVMRDILKKIAVHLRGLEGTTLHRLFRELAQVIVKNAQTQGRKMESIEDIIETEDFSMLADRIGSMVDQWCAQATEQGRMQGKMEGKMEGRMQGRMQGVELGTIQGIELGKKEGMVIGKIEMLLDLARSKWGALPESLVDSINSIQDASMLSTLSKNFLQMSSMQDFARAVQTLLAQEPKKQM